MVQLNAGIWQLAMFALAFGGPQLWWIGSILRRRRLPRPMTEREFRHLPECIWLNESHKR